MNPKSLKNLKPSFKKGQSGNPGGKPQGLTLAKALRDVTTDADKIKFAKTTVEILTWTIEDMLTPTGELDPVKVKLYDSTREFYAERTEGKVTQPMGNPDGSPLMFVTVLPKLKSDAND